MKFLCFFVFFMLGLSAAVAGIMLESAWLVSAAALLLVPAERMIPQ